MTWWENTWAEWQDKQVRGPERRAIPSGALPRLTLFFATGFLSGFIPYFSGTAGTLSGLVLYALVLRHLPPLPYLALLCLLIPLGSLLCGRAEGYLRKKDAAPIVGDEMIGYWTSVALLPYDVWTLWGGFLLFRLFDIFKPPPIRALQSLKKGWGIVLDDVLAGVYANLLLRAIFILIKGYGSS